MIDRSRTTEAERQVLREALLDYVARCNGVRPVTLRQLQLGQKQWRAYQAGELLKALDDR